MYWINALTAICGAIVMVSEALKGRRLLAGMWACLASYAVFNKIFPTVLPAWLVFSLPVTGVLLFVFEHINRRRQPAAQQDDDSILAGH